MLISTFLNIIIFLTHFFVFFLGNKILSNQLELMDEKFLDLRNKLDYARESSLKKVDRAERIARDLRLKFALGSSIGGRGSTANRNMNLNLDKIELPDIFTTGPIGMKIMYFYIIN